LALDTAVTQPAPRGNEYVTATRVYGLASYSSTTHQTVSAQSCRLSSVLYANAIGLDPTGTYYGRVVQPNGSGASTFVLRWYVLATNAEVNGVDLSTFFLIVEAVGN
jgi:hypothetical protein